MHQFADFVPQLRGDLLKYALHLSSSQALAEDLVQDSMLKAFKAWSRFVMPDCPDPAKVVRGWMYTIVHRVFLSHCKSESVRRSDDTSSILEAIYGKECEDPREDNDLQLSSEVEAAMRSLTVDYRRIIELAVREMPYKDMAKELEIPLGTVMSRLSRARRELTRLLGGYIRENNLLRDSARKDANSIKTPESVKSQANSIDAIMVCLDSEELGLSEPTLDSNTTW